MEPFYQKRRELHCKTRKKNASNLPPTCPVSRFLLSRMIPDERAWDPPRGFRKAHPPWGTPGSAAAKLVESIGGVDRCRANSIPVVLHTSGPGRKQSSPEEPHQLSKPSFPLVLVCENRRKLRAAGLRPSETTRPFLRPVQLGPRARPTLWERSSGREGGRAACARGLSASGAAGLTQSKVLPPKLFH